MHETTQKKWFLRKLAQNRFFLFIPTLLIILFTITVSMLFQTLFEHQAYSVAVSLVERQKIDVKKYFGHVIRETQGFDTNMDAVKSRLRGSFDTLLHGGSLSQYINNDPYPTIPSSPTETISTRIRSDKQLAHVFFIQAEEWLENTRTQPGFEAKLKELSKLKTRLVESMSLSHQLYSQYVQTRILKEAKLMIFFAVVILLLGLSLGWLLLTFSKLYKKLKIEVAVREQAQEKLAHAKEMAESASEAKTKFLTYMSHELRTPLNAIIGFSTMLENERLGVLSSKQKDYASYIQSSGKHLLSLINDLLDLTKIEAGKMELNLRNVELKTLLEKSITIVKVKAMNKQIQIMTEIDDNLGIVCVDERKLRQIVFNLLANAVKFTPEGGQVGLKARAVGLSYVEISFWDTGIGIEKQDYDKVFSEFVRIDSAVSRKESGSGLGLALTKNLVELHGGKLSFRSKGKDQGTEFTVSIPARPNCQIEALSSMKLKVTCNGRQTLKNHKEKTRPTYTINKMEDAPL